MFKKVFKNTILLSLSQITSRVVGFIFFIFLARFLGVKDFGVYVFTISFVYNFIPVADFGIERLILRDISREPEKTNDYLKRLIPLRVFLAAIAYLILLVFGLLGHLQLSGLTYLAIFGLALFPYNVAFLLISFASAKEKMKYLAGANLLLILMTVIFGFTALKLNLGLLGALFAYPISCFILAGLSVLKSESMGMKLGWSIDISFFKQALSQAWIFGIFAVIAVFYLRTTLILINYFSGPEATGIYGSVFKFVEAIILIPQSLALALFPLSARLFVQDSQRLKKIYLKSILLLFAISLPVWAIMTFFSKEIVFFAYGNAYLEAAKVMPILGVSLVLFFINALPGNIIQNSPKVKSFLPYAISIFVFVCLVSFILIPKYSFVGAAWAVVAGEFYGFVISNYFVFKFLKSD